MIPRITTAKHIPAWQTELALAIRSSRELFDMLEIIPPADYPEALPTDFPLRVPRGFVSRMRTGDINDPLLRQVLPIADEHYPVEGYSVDPLGELNAMPESGLLHKYQGRALLTVTGACAVNCRYCFRRHFPYSEANPAIDDWQPTLNYLADNPDISEIILSGGDPLSLTDERLSHLVDRLASVPSLETLRIHTRFPVVLPERIDAVFLDWISRQRLNVVIVIHSNHPNEIDAQVYTALQQLNGAGITLLNQSVLLKGVNDRAETLVELGKKLFSCNVLPYYLHMLDRVQGAAHFAVSEARARQLMKDCHAILPGYLVPRLVRETAGESGKTWI